MAASGVAGANQAFHREKWKNGLLHIRLSEVAHLDCSHISRKTLKKFAHGQID
jgi:hypothetical protein